MAFIKHYDAENITVELKTIGEALLVTIHGGDSPHIGSVSTFSVEDGLTSNCITGHKDNHISDKVAERLGKVLNTTVTVVCGVHYDEFTETIKLRSLEMPDIISEDILNYMN